MNVEERQPLLPGDLVFSRPEAQLFVNDSSWAQSWMVPAGTPAIVLLGRRRLTGAGRQWHQLLVAGAGVWWVESPSSFEKK